MKNMNLAQSAALCSAAMLMGLGTAPAFAEDSGWYLGGNLGYSAATIDEDKIVRALESDGFTVTDFSDNEDDLGFKLFGGYQFNRYLAIEGGYFNLGSFDFTAQTDPPGSLSGDIDVDGINLDLVGLLPLRDKLSLFARLGANHAQADTNFTGDGGVQIENKSFSERSTNFKFGVGGQWAIHRKAGLRLEAERYRIEDGAGNEGDIDLLSLGLVVRFGAEPYRAPIRRSVAPAPKPAPVPVTVPSPERTERYCHIVDIQFEIDADQIQREEEEKLLVLAQYLKKYPNTTVAIEGHTDNVGTAPDNLRLSQRRADNVRTYLINAHGIDPSRLVAVGYGDTRPVADNRTEQGKRANRRIGAVVACVTDIAGLETVPARVTMAMEIEFALDEADVRSQYREDLRKVAEFMKDNPAIIATVEGHSDNATPSNAKALSLLRAQNVVDYLVENFGVAESRLTAEGFGQTRRFAYNTTRDGRQQNRRVNIILEYPR